jgi:hemerythrin-like domain-containing protein
MKQMATDSLRAEHAAVLQKLDRLEQICLGPDRDEETMAQLKELGFFFQKDFWTHFTKEEEALFPAIGTFLPVNSGPIPAMLAEHTYIRTSNEKVQHAVRLFLDIGDTQSAELLKDYGTTFVELLREHIDKEDGIIFEIAETQMAPAQKEKVGKLFDEIENKAVLLCKAVTM